MKQRCDPVPGSQTTPQETAGPRAGSSWRGGGAKGACASATGDPAAKINIKTPRRRLHTTNPRISISTRNQRFPTRFVKSEAIGPWRRNLGGQSKAQNNPCTNPLFLADLQAGADDRLFGSQIHWECSETSGESIAARPKKMRKCLIWSDGQVGTGMSPLTDAHLRPRTQISQRSTRRRRQRQFAKKCTCRTICLTRAGWQGAAPGVNETCQFGASTPDRATAGSALVWVWGSASADPNSAWGRRFPTAHVRCQESGTAYFSPSSLSSFSVIVLCHRSLSSFSVIVLCHRSLSSFSVTVLCHRSLSSFSVIVLCHRSLSPFSVIDPSCGRWPRDRFATNPYPMITHFRASLCAGA